MGRGGPGRAGLTPACPSPDIDVWNPAFDVTPHELITGGIITEWGVFAPAELRGMLAARAAAAE